MKVLHDYIVMVVFMLLMVDVIARVYDVNMLNTVKNVLAGVLGVSPSSVSWTVTPTQSNTS